VVTCTKLAVVLVQAPAVGIAATAWYRCGVDIGDPKRATGLDMVRILHLLFSLLSRMTEGLKAGRACRQHKMPEVGLLASAAVASACLYGLVSGFNDGGNLLASFTSGRVITPRQAVALLLAVLAGPLLVGYAVATTVGANVIDLREEGALALTVLTLASVAVVLLSWRVGIPTSMTLALVGAMIGWELAGDRKPAIHWPGLARVVIGMPVSVLAGGIVALLLYTAVRRGFGGMPHASLLRFSRFQFATAALQALAYGANDLEKTVGLLVVALAFSSHDHSLTFSNWAATLVAFGLFVIGSVAGGARVARRVGLGVLRVRPMQALAQQLASGGVVGILALGGAPVSMTQTIDGGLVGVGAAVRASAVRWGIVRAMLASWLATLPAALALSALVHLSLRFLGLAP
jgi:PiT family inorganic phosphate transporter